MKEREPRKKETLEVPNSFYVDGEFNIPNRRIFCETLDQLAQLNPKSKISFFITSRGGSVDELSLMIDEMDKVRELYGVKIAAIGKGYVYSAGAMLFALADERYSLPNTNYMIHDMSADFGPQTLREYRHDLIMGRRQQRFIERRMMRSMKKTLPEIRSLWQKYLSEEQAMKVGLVDAIIRYSK